MQMTPILNPMELENIEQGRGKNPKIRVMQVIYSLLSRSWTVPMLQFVRVVRTLHFFYIGIQCMWIINVCVYLSIDWNFVEYYRLDTMVLRRGTFHLSLFNFIFVVVDLLSLTRFIYYKKNSFELLPKHSGWKYSTKCV